MRLYLDDDSASWHLLRVLRQAGHDVESPRDVQLAGKPDPVHLTYCIRVHRVLISANHRDFEFLHNLVIASGGSHPGIFAIRKDNSPRDMSPVQIARAIDKLLAAGAVVPNQFIILNHWR
jgi:predicted nuclease of predicted toxin-antitoxin system